MIYDPRFDLTKEENRRNLEKVIEEEDPYLLVFAPVCGPWSQWQNVNLNKSQQTYETIMADRKKWYPVIKRLTEVVEKRLKKGREVLVENPWSSLMWKLKVMEDLLEKDNYNMATGEPLQLCQLDQCMYGLVDQATGIPHKKSTGMLLSSSKMKERLQVTCDHLQDHIPLEGGNLTKKAQEWPKKLCQEILRGAVEEMKNLVLKVAFPAEYEEEGREASGPMDGIHSSLDVEESAAKRRRIDLDELSREEDFEQLSLPTEQEIVHQKEKKRKTEWQKISREQRVALRRLHGMMGHCSNSALIRMLKASMAKKEAIEAAKHFRCSCCEELKKDEEPRVARPTRPEAQLKFNQEVSVDVLEIHDAQGGRHSILSMVDIATHYHVAVRVAPGGTPSSKVCAEAMNLSWFTPFGAPRVMVSDQGVHNSGKVNALLQAHGVEVRKVGVRAPFQLGLGERHGGLLKDVMKRSIHNGQLQGAEAISSLRAEATRAKNNLINLGGYSPVQWVLGHTPDDLTSLMSHDVEEHLGVHQSLVDEEEKPSQEKFMMQLLIRQTAKEAFMQADSSQKIRKAMLRKAVPVRGPYRTGDLVCFSKKGKWYGPARVLGHEGKSSLWLIHSGVSVLVAETSCRPASTEEIYKTQVLELRPSVKRGREIIGEDDDVHVPFAEDVDQARSLRPRFDGQSPYVDVIPNLETGGSGVATIPDLPIDEPSPYEDIFGPAGGDSISREETGNEPMQEPSNQVTDQEIEDILGPPPGLEGEQISAIESMNTSSGQPESEAHPEVGGLLPEEASVHPSELHQQPQGQGSSAGRLGLGGALLNPSRLDGLPDGYVAVKEERRWAFLVTRREDKVKKRVKKFQKNQKKTGAGREVSYNKMSAEVQSELQKTRLKAWTNWKNYTDGRWIGTEELEKMKAADPSLRVIPTRWVETNKAEIGQPDIYKSRLVVRGDLEDSSRMRTDSPTCSQTLISLTMALSACRDTDLWSGDISAAFLQGSKLDRTLVLRMPPGGVPDEDQGEFYVVSSTVYGTKDAPRGWYKNLHQTMVSKGFKPIPHEAAAYRLLEQDGSLAGIVIVHVDDLLWTGGKTIEMRMQEVCHLYKFGKIEKNEIKYCGREVKKDSNGISVTCPSLIDRVRPIYLDGMERKNKSGKIGEEKRGQLRSVIGSLAWLARVCRPDLAYAVSKLQSCVHHACFDDISYANTIINIARKSKNTGIHFPLRAFEFEEAMIVGIQDASFANDYEANQNGDKGGYRSQSGRLTCLGPPSFKETKSGVLLLLDWHSTTIKRVCRSTLQAESMSLLSGMEECEHLRMVLHGLKNDHRRHDSGWKIEAMDEIQMDLFTDCRSLEESVNQAGLGSVNDKRLAIDLTGIRQQVWRQKKEETGDPLLTDRIPEDGTTRLFWVNTEKMAADSLAKSMKPKSLEGVMFGCTVDLTPEKDNACETDV